MATLVHLNGPSGAGKSTLAQQYVNDHAGVLNLDIDSVVSLIGGWRSNFFATLSPARELAIVMAETHLRNEGDVVMPQLVTSVTQAQRFERAAQRANARYVEVALMVEPAQQIERFRAKAYGSEVATQIERAIDAEGGDGVLKRIHQDFTEYTVHRPAAVPLDVSAGVDQSYRALLKTLMGA